VQGWNMTDWRAQHCSTGSCVLTGGRRRHDIFLLTRWLDQSAKYTFSASCWCRRTGLLSRTLTV